MGCPCIIPTAEYTALASISMGGGGGILWHKEAKLSPQSHTSNISSVPSSALSAETETGLTHGSSEEAWSITTSQTEQGEGKPTGEWH